MTTYPASFANDPFVARVASNLALVRSRIAASAPAPDQVRVVAVTKTFGVEAVLAAAAVGLGDVGENYVDELEAKRDQAGATTLRWHYLGALQTNKIARVCKSADVIAGVSRPRELDRLAACQARAVLYLQVDFTGAPARNGAPANEIEGLAHRARALGLDLRGLMCVAAPGEAAARAAFSSTARLADDLGLEERSMGMTEDLEIACELGSTEVRVGRALFGPRVPPGTLA
ncbi:MAG: YggS family pyridoxal phosphate enzyme [Acidimicrobiales bacterium]